MSLRSKSIPIVVCLMLSSGCKTTGGRTLAEDDKQPQKGKLKLSTVALAAVGIAAGVFGSFKLSKYLLRSDFDKQVDNLHKLIKKHSQNPDDDKVMVEMLEVQAKIENLAMEATGKELEDMLTKMSKVMLGLPDLDKQKAIRQVEANLTSLRAGEIPQDMHEQTRNLVLKTIPNPRDTYANLDDYTAAYLDEVGVDNVSSHKEIGLDRMWNNYDEVIDEITVRDIEASRSQLIEQLEETLQALRAE